MGLIFNRRRKRSSARDSSSRSLISNIPLVRWIGPSVTTVGVVVVAFYVLTGRINLPSLDSFTAGGGSDALTVQPVSLEQLGPKSNETIRIATCNIQVFGEKKSTTRVVDGVDVMGSLAQIVAGFDVVAIQEVRGGDAMAIQRLVDLLNASGGNYTATLSRPIGRTSQTESYAFVWDRARIMLMPDSAYVVQDTSDRMHREPMVATFQTRTVPADGRMPFSFTLINAHTDPDEVTDRATSNEISVLDDVFVRVRQYEYESSGEEDCILLGDLNVDRRGLGELLQIPGLISIAADFTTNTRGDKTYDHIMIDPNMTREFTGRFGVYDMKRELGLTEQQALLLSDHLPVWAEFTAYEMPHSADVTSVTGTTFR
jgi:deoxyribonuclease-1-like protein